MDLEEFSEDFTYEVVLVLDEGVLGVVVEDGAHFSTILYYNGGMLFEEILENTEFVSLDELLEGDE